MLGLFPKNGNIPRAKSFRFSERFVIWVVSASCGPKSRSLQKSWQPLFESGRDCAPGWLGPGMVRCSSSVAPPIRSAAQGGIFCPWTARLGLRLLPSRNPQSCLQPFPEMHRNAAGIEPLPFCATGRPCREADRSRAVERQERSYGPQVFWPARSIRLLGASGRACCFRCAKSRTVQIDRTDVR